MFFILKITGNYQRDCVVVKASTSRSVDLGLIPSFESYLKTLKNGIYSFPAWHSAFKGGCREQVGKFACCVLGQGTYQDAPTLMWMTGGLVFPPKRGLVVGEASDRKNKCHVIKMQIICCGDPQSRKVERQRRISGN